mmetsp:Transcript_19336/g.28616  ORF Transcript_19336/g.28616 Transcript_19336/m.28616 type:complete len:495 (-) Transcript_19336:134-1618(-)|eukprot:CAMPEP_0194203442 /NCGR_PEP_ID=MMETSP0156-20130528/3214_1 /TAXON_ID=33649 /ORGANISM="Thalassionema nitzschioides, Strain L26-B" /LENGTH=494 /DNA_ID=CAMNT_0038929191 /DNA_START=155 /DNA_END=1639 /DNA_ORIENTATION=+
MKSSLSSISLFLLFLRGAAFSGLKPLVFRSRTLRKSFELAASTDGGVNFDLLSAYGKSKPPASLDSAQDVAETVTTAPKAALLENIDNVELMSNLKLKAAESSMVSSEKVQDVVTKVTEGSYRTSQDVADWLSNQADSTVKAASSVKVSEQIESIGNWISDKTEALSDRKIVFPEFDNSDAIDRFFTVNEKFALIKENTVEWATNGLTWLTGDSLPNILGFQEYAIWYILLLSLISYQAGKSVSAFEMKLELQGTNAQKQEIAKESTTKVANVEDTMAEDLVAVEKAKAEIEATMAEAIAASEKATKGIEANAAQARAAAEKAKMEMKKAEDEKIAAERAKVEMEAAARKAKEEMKNAEEDIATVEKAKKKARVKGGSISSPATTPESNSIKDPKISKGSAKDKTKAKKKVKKVIKKRVKNSKSADKESVEAGATLGDGKDVGNNPFKSLTSSALKRKTVQELSTYLSERGVSVTDEDGKTLKKSLLLDAVNNL